MNSEQSNALHLVALDSLLVHVLVPFVDYVAYCGRRVGKKRSQSVEEFAKISSLVFQFVETENVADGFSQFVSRFLC